MDAVPRGGEAVMLLGEEMTVWNVAWEVCEGDTVPVAWVAVKTPQEYRRAFYGAASSGQGEGRLLQHLREHPVPGESPAGRGG